MASFLYEKFKEQALQAGINLATADVRVILVSAGYTPVAATHEFLSDVPGGAVRVATLAAGVTTKTFTLGVFKHANASFIAVTGSVITALVYYIHTGTEGTSRLICYLDNTSGLPYTPNGANITYTPPTGANGVFKL